jgi:ABC-type transport system involved in cytochrome bd biosynthesis fused ATPase/permease subunit
VKAVFVLFRRKWLPVTARLYVLTHSTFLAMGVNLFQVSGQFLVACSLYTNARNNISRKTQLWHDYFGYSHVVKEVVISRLVQRYIIDLNV